MSASTIVDIHIRYFLSLDDSDHSINFIEFPDEPHHEVSKNKKDVTGYGPKGLLKFIQYLLNIDHLFYLNWLIILNPFTLELFKHTEAVINMPSIST
jgi:hypothetical protein